MARTLSRNGSLFLVDVFDGDERMAQAVNHLLVVGFWLINLGFVAYALQIHGGVADAQAAAEALSRKLGAVLLVLGAMHFGNLFVLSRCAATTGSSHQLTPPVPPTSTVRLPGPFAVTGGAHVRTGMIGPRDRAVRQLTVLYDAHCPLCRWVRGLAGGEPAAGSAWIGCPAARRTRERGSAGWTSSGTREEVTVVSDAGAVWSRRRRVDRLPLGDRAHRGLADRLAQPSWPPHARAIAPCGGPSDAGTPQPATCPARSGCPRRRTPAGYA